MKLFKFFVIENFVVVSFPLYVTITREPSPDPFGRFDRLHRCSVTIPFREPFDDSFDCMVHSLDRMIHSMEGLDHSLDGKIHSLDRMIHSTAFRDSFKTPTRSSFTPTKLDISSNLKLPSIEMAPPMAMEVNGIERAEDEPIEYQCPGYCIEEPEDGIPVCQCSDEEVWENFDTSDGTGDHERFK